MAISERLGLMVLAMSILSYGLSGASFAQSADDIEEPIVELPISVMTGSEFYLDGNTITISGKLRSLDTNNNPDITLVIIDPDGSNFVHVGQAAPESDGTYQFSLVAGGPKWAKSGEYTVKVQYGGPGVSTTSTFEFTAAEGAEPEPAPEPEPPTQAPPPPPEPSVLAPPPPPPMPDPEPEDPTCGPGTVLKDGICVVAQTDAPSGGGGCLIATAAYGSELAPQVQLLREVRDNTLLSTESGATFMSGFNSLYYSFSPAIADLERQNPLFKETVKMFITPMLSTLSIMTLADEGSESSVLALGLSVIALNMGMYIAAPAAVAYTVKNRLKTRN